MRTNSVTRPPSNIHKKTKTCNDKQAYYIDLLVPFLRETASPLGEILRVLIRRLKRSTPVEPYTAYETEILLIVSLAERRAAQAERKAR